MAKIRIEDLPGLRGPAIDVKGETLVRNHQGQNATGHQDSLDLGEPIDDIGNVLEHVGSDDVVELIPCPDRFSKGLVRTLHDVHIDDCIDQVGELGVGGVFLFERRGAGMIEIGDAPLGPTYLGIRQRPDFKSTHRSHLNQHELGSAVGHARTVLVERPRRWEALYILERIGSYREAAWAIEGAAASARAITHRRGVNSPKCHLIDSVGQPPRRTGTWAYPATFDM